VDEGIINLKDKSHWAGLDVGDIEPVYLFICLFIYLFIMFHWPCILV